MVVRNVGAVDTRAVPKAVGEACAHDGFSRPRSDELPQFGNIQDQLIVLWFSHGVVIQYRFRGPEQPDCATIRSRQPWTTFSALAARFPDERGTIEAIDHIQQWADAVERRPFREPKSLIIRTRGKVQVGPVSLADLNAWRSHLANGTIVRLRGLETAFLAELAADRVSAAMTLARAHMEVAGLAAYGADVLLTAGRDGAWDRLAKVVQQVYFGSSMRIQAKNTPALDDFLLEEVCPIRPGEFIRAMDRFVGPDSTRYQMIYGLLSDYAHPVTSRSFFDVLSEDGDGWLLHYRMEDRLDQASAHMAVEILLENMRIGYACASLLGLATVLPDGAGGFRLRTATPEQTGEIWLRFLDLETTRKPPAG
jgi:hypothetical protein